uniref:Uncharacterized protein n=1 Tax=Ciona intestinalis TaxID=7719 RepID=F6YK74_CIOIN
MNKSALLLLLVIGLLVLTETTDAWRRRVRWHTYNQKSTSDEENDSMMDAVRDAVMQKLSQQDE